MAVHWLALGDSYTICTCASSHARRWPDIVARRLSREDQPVEVTNLGASGWTTQQVIDGQARRLAERDWDIVTVLAGVNDEYQGLDAVSYGERIRRLHQLISTSAPRCVVALSIPDYSYTRVGRATKPEADTVARLCEFNEIAELSAHDQGFVWIDLFDVSRSRMQDPGWVGPDGLHPSDAQYAAWAQHIAAHMPQGF